MAHFTDWLPRSYVKKLVMAANWEKIFNEEVVGSDGKIRKKHEVWRIGVEEVEKLSRLAATAEKFFKLSKQEAAKTKVVTAALVKAAAELEAYMRFLKRSYFHTPPLSLEDKISLGLTVREARRARRGTPDATIAVNGWLSDGYNRLRISVTVISGDLNDRKNKGRFFIAYMLVPPGGAAPEDPACFTGHFVTERFEKTVDFPHGSSGSDAYFCARIEGDDRIGAWGPITKTRVP